MPDWTINDFQLRSDFASVLTWQMFGIYKRSNFHKQEAYTVNADTLTVVLKDNIGFDGPVSDLYKALLGHRCFRNVPYVPSGTTFLYELEMLVPKSQKTGLEITLSPNGRVRIQQAVEAQQDPVDKAMDAKLRSEYNNSSDLRREFGTFERYSAYQRGVASGQISATAGVKGRDVINQGREVSTQTVDARLPLEERCRQRWDLEPETRREFHDNYNAFLAYEKANARGQVRQLKSLAG